ncbi:protein kinase, ATP binding site-containing protein [Tanacetum coccineum]
MKKDSIVYKHWGIFSKKYVEMLKWFYLVYLNYDMLEEIPPVIGVMEINLLSLHKIVDSLGGYLCVTLGDKWKTIASLQGLTNDDGEAMKGCYKKFIDMVQVYYETAKMPWYEKKPKEDVVESSSGNARVKDPQGSKRADAGIGEALEEDMNKKTQFGVRLEGNLEEEAEEGSITDSNDFEVINHEAAFNNTKRFRKLEDSFIPLKDINMAIGVKGPETQIGDGGFGVVYKGQPSERWQNRTVAIKCLRPESYQGEYEFRNELNMIFSFNHENIIPYIGYCDEGNEKIIVYEFASNGSLDCHINDKNRRRCLTWEHRLKICLGAARGLDYLHSGLGEDNKVIHRDVKSGNILLDHNLVAKVCDFGLSKSGLVNQLQTQVFTNAAGTNFYMDPVYHESGVLRKESDVYSFGVVMFELLSGMLAYNRRRLEDGKPKPLINLVRRYYDYKPEMLIDPLIRDEIDSRSFDTYSKAAFQCISFNSKDRPTMEMIVDRIEEALEFHVSKQRESQAKGDAELNHSGSLE